jgi:hypothetical protein
MCFSATGSFALAAILTGVGVASVARSSSRSSRMFAAAPLLFGAQQATEGVAWLTIGVPSEAMLQHLAVDAFLGFALVVWPLWVPISLQRMERDPARRRVLTMMCWFSGAIAASAALLLSRWQPFARASGRSRSYDYPGTSNAWLHAGLVVAYTISTIAPFFVSTARLVRTIGVMLIGSLLAASLIRREALTSVWCFFAAILSGLIMIAVHQEEPSPERVESFQHLSDGSARPIDHI